MPKQILLVEPFLGGSHAQWADGLKEHSRHAIDITGLPDRFWKWRMYGSAVTLAEKLKQDIHQYDLVLASDMLDLPAFLGLTGYRGKTALYFHESQWLYPWSPIDRDKQKGRDFSYGFLNFRSAIAADAVFFNSKYHRRAFLEKAPQFLKRLPDFQLLSHVDDIRSKSKVLYPGLSLSSLSEISSNPKKQKGDPVILWNHRWEYDKNPELFLRGISVLKEEGYPFQLILLGENQDKQHPVYEKILQQFPEHILHSGFVENKSKYAALLQQSDILPITSNQDFFGISALEGMYCGAFPILPDKLAFPEHLPDNITQREQYYYTSDAAFIQKLEKVVSDKLWKSYEPGTVQSWVKRYDWPNIISSYDKALSNSCP